MCRSERNRQGPPEKGGFMPVRKTKVNGKTKYQYGTTGKKYSSRAKAEKQGVAIRLSQMRAGKKVK